MGSAFNAKLSGPHASHGEDRGAKYFDEIQSLADELHRPSVEIEQLYESVLQHLQDHAQVTDFLPVLVSKKVREMCRASR